jgi:hypothetical protein
VSGSQAAAYALRGQLKYNRLKDRTGGIADIQQAARLFQQQGDRANYQNAIDLLQEWGLSNGDSKTL